MGGGGGGGAPILGDWVLLKLVTVFGKIKKILFRTGF
jgi:hypothetical protein